MKDFFLEAIRPYEEKIEHLEELNDEKEREIVTLKHAIFNLSRIIESFKDVVEENEAQTPPPSTAKTSAVKTPKKEIVVPPQIPSTEPYVQGYNGKSARNNIHFLEDSIVIYTNGNN